VKLRTYAHINLILTVITYLCLAGAVILALAGRK